MSGYAAIFESNEHAVRILKKGTVLYHGTGEPFDYEKPRPGGYDKIFWTADKKWIAKTYIPTAGASTGTSPEALLDRPDDSELHKFLGIDAKNIERDEFNRVIRYNENPDLATINAESDELEKESLAIYKKINELNQLKKGAEGEMTKLYKLYSDDMAEDSMDELIEKIKPFDSESKRLRREIEQLSARDKEIAAEIRNLNIKERQLELVRHRLAEKKYEPDWDGRYKIKFHNGQAVTGDYKLPGKMLTVTLKRDMRMLDISTGEPDLNNVQYHNHELFKNAREQGYDGVIIDDFAQSEVHGNFGHTSFGFFKDTMPDLEVTSVEDAVHPGEYMVESVGKQKSELVTRLEQLKPQFAAAAQEVYEEWGRAEGEDYFEDAYAGGGICHIIAEEICKILDKAGGFEYLEHTYDHVQHVVVIAKLEGDEDEYIETVTIDIPYWVYEEGGGFSWTRIPDIEIEAGDVELYHQSMDIDNWNAMFDQ